MMLIGACAIMFIIAAFYRWLIYEAVEEKSHLLDVELEDVND